MANSTRSIPLDLLREWGLPYEADEIVVSDETEDVGRRWMDVRTIVFKAPDDGQHYALSFDVGKTEHQESRWDDCLEDPVVCEHVEARKVALTQWVPIELDESGAPVTAPPNLGSASPTDPAELGAWLRALPDDTILASGSGNAWQLNYGVESGAGEDREFRAMLSALGAEVFEITEEHVDLKSLAELAPFTVLALGLDDED